MTSVTYKCSVIYKKCDILANQEMNDCRYLEKKCPLPKHFQIFQAILSFEVHVLEVHVRIDSTDRLTPLSLGVFELIISGSRSWLFCKL